MNMKILAVLLIFSTIDNRLIKCRFTSNAMVQDVLQLEDAHVDPYEDQYIRKIFHMDIEEVMQLPKLDDDVFLLTFQRTIYDLTSYNSVTNSTIQDEKLDDPILSQRDSDEKWGALVEGGPLTVNYLGSLMLLASKQDFALVSPTPSYVYEHIKHPNSFRATLIQLGNEMYSCFLAAHTNMDRIQMNMQLLPNHIKTALKLLTSASPRLIKTLLPLTLDNIGRVAGECVKSANSTIQKYESLNSFLLELTRITVGTHTSNNNELGKVIENMRESAAEQDLLNSQLTNIREEFQTAREALQKAQKEYNEAYHAISVGRKRGWKPKKVFRSIGNFVSKPLQALGCIMSSCGGGSNSFMIDNIASENAWKKAELALARLKDAQEKYDQWYSQMVEKQNKLAGTISQLSQLDLSKIDHETLFQILVSATREITDIQVQWDKMVRFFAKLSMYAENTRATIMYEFIGVIEATEVIGGTLDDADREFYTILLLETAEEIDRGAHLLYTMASTYFDISDRYIMNQIAGIAALTVTETDIERETQMKRISQNTLMTSAKVSRMAMERRQQYDQRNEDRQMAYEQFIEQAILEELQSSIGK